mmetsp:Transcript_23932/g.59654  ORF Transcript_23932/g.59654 Transcript_23932/m.59654 type:complete len:514 (-) Transcript_23932:76-1617(-)
MTAPAPGGDSVRHNVSGWTGASSRGGSFARGLLETSQDGERRSARDLPTYVVWQANRDLRRQSSRPSEQEMLSREVVSREDFMTVSPVPSQSEKLPLSAWTRNLMGMRSILFHPFSTLLVAFPLGILSAQLGWDSAWTFWLNFLAMVPLAKILGDATEELDACLHNEVVSGLLNATFGNAVEMIITIQTLRAGLIEVVKATLLGSVLSNMLLVLGMSFFFGGILELGSDGSRASGLDHIAETASMSARQPLLDEDRGGVRLVTEKEQTFIVNSALVSVTMLLVSCLSFALPTVFTQAFGEEDTVLSISRTAAGIVGLSYFAYLFFQLITHRKMLASSEEGDDEDDDNDGLTVGFSVCLLALTTVFVSISSELLVNVIEDVVEKANISECFIGIILLPIVGNACEHAAAVRFAIQNKPGLSISIAVGSSVQVALFVVPFAVLMAWSIGQPMTLDFGLLNTTVLIICVLVVMSIVVDGRSNWLEGYMLCSAYALIAVMYWHVKSFGDHPFQKSEF